MSEANKDLIRRYQDAYNDRELDRLDELLHPAWTSNNWPEAVPQSIENAKMLHGMFVESFPDLHVTTEDLFAEGDRVAQRWRVRGTHKGEIIGLPPTGREVTAGGISIFRIAGGRIVEHWAYADELGFLDQIGASLPPELLAFRHH
jgi:predicted ester cyclase